jgi:ferredoxin--NADP+ reductase
LAPGKHLWLLASGTGLGPFISMLRTPSLCQRFERIVLAHSVRYPADLIYRDELTAAAATTYAGRLHYLPIVTREAFPGALSQRIPALVDSGALQAAAGVDLALGESRVMVCGNPELTREMRAWLAARGFQPSRRSAPGQMAFEKYW